MPTIEIHLRTPEGAVDESLTVQLTDDEVERLRNFSRLMSRLASTQLVNRGIPAITKMQYAEGAMHFVCEQYSNGELHELLHVLRPLILQEERSSFQNIGAIVGRRLRHQLISARLKHLRRVYAEGDLSRFMQIKINEHPLFADETIKLWLNGEQYHSDDDKAAAWCRLENAMTASNARALVIEQLRSKVMALDELHSVVELLLEAIDSTSPR